MKVSEKYLRVFKTIHEWVTISEWIQRVTEMYPEILEKANIDARNQVTNTTGLREIMARISSNVSSETPKK